MKKTIIIVILLMFSMKITAQVGINTANPDSAAALDIVSTNQGLLPPRIANVAAIATPVAGLMIYDLSNQCMRYYNGTIWSDCMGGIMPLFTCGNSMTDIDGNNYPTVLIGGQCWMAANLKVSRYPNGDTIPYIDNNVTWSTLVDNNIDDGYSFYGDSNNDGSVDIAYPDYGALYSFSAAIADNWVRDNSLTNSEGGQGICPDGWHLPTNAEWNTLATFLGGSNLAGGKMKEAGTLHWNNPNIGATNSSGFTGLPSGFRLSSNGSFSLIFLVTRWWSGTEFNTSNTYGRILDVYNTAVYGNNYNKSSGLCVRCLRD